MWDFFLLMSFSQWAGNLERMGKIIFLWCCHWMSTLGTDLLEKSYIFFVLSWKYIKKWNQSQSYIVISECCLGKSFFLFCFHTFICFFCLFIWLLFSCIGCKVHMIVGFGDFSPASFTKEVRTWENTHKEVKRLSLTLRNCGLCVREHPRNIIFFDGFRVKETVILWTRRMEGLCLTLL